MTEPNPPRLGFLGTGRIASAMVEGLSNGTKPFPVLVSPRNEAKSRELEQRWGNVRRAGSNQEVVDGSDVVFIALRAATAREEVPRLRFRPDHTVVSLSPVMVHAEVKALVQPVSQVFRALCLPCVARHLGQIPCFPAGQAVEALLGHLCQPVPTRDEEELHRLWATTNFISTYYALLQTFSDWCEKGGARPETAQGYLVATFTALTRMAEDGAPFAALAAHAATPGGLNERVLRRMRDGTMFADLEANLDDFLEFFKPGPG